MKISEEQKDNLIWLGLTLASFGILTYSVEKVTENKVFVILLTISLLATLMFGIFAMIGSFNLIRRSFGKSKES